MTQSNVTRPNGLKSDVVPAQPSDAHAQPSEALAVVKELAHEASGVGSEFKDLAGGVAREAQKTVEKKVVERKSRVAEDLGGVAYALRQTTTDEAHVSAEIRPFIEKAAEQVDRISHYIERSSPSTMVADVQALARREPALFLGGAFILGLVGGRFLKATQPMAAAAPSSAPSDDYSSQEMRDPAGQT